MMTPEKIAGDKKKSGPNPLGIFLVFVLVAIAGGTIVYSLSDWSAPAQARLQKNPVPATPDAVHAGMQIYLDRCKNCHGENGNGRGPRAEKLSVAPADFRDTHAMSLVTDGELFWKISEGHRPMPAFKGSLSDLQRWQLVDAIRTFSQPAVDPPPESTFPAPDKDNAPR
jgi:mono/diheme cytochrome c family protein